MSAGSCPLLWPPAPRSCLCLSCLSCCFRCHASYCMGPKAARGREPWGSTSARPMTALLVYGWWGESRNVTQSSKRENVKTWDLTMPEYRSNKTMHHPCDPFTWSEKAGRGLGERTCLHVRPGRLTMLECRFNKTTHHPPMLRHTEREREPGAVLALGCHLTVSR